jgi:flagellar biosynthetic protein FliQ
MLLEGRNAMGSTALLDVFGHTVLLVMLIIAVVILPGLIVGFIVSMLQAATQINEASLSFIPKFIVTLLSLMVTGPWIMHLIVEYTQELMSNFRYYIG